MTIKTVPYTRKSFNVEAVRVTKENIEDVATWCSGEIRHTKDVPEDNITSAPYIKVEVARALTERQKRGYIGDWILKIGKSFKVYSDKAFKLNFDKTVVRGGNDNNYGAHLSDEDVAATL